MFNLIYTTLTLARNSLVQVQTGLVWPTSIVEINLSQNKIKHIQPKVKSKCENLFINISSEFKNFISNMARIQNQD